MIIDPKKGKQPEASSQQQKILMSTQISTQMKFDFRRKSTLNRKIGFEIYYYSKTATTSFTPGTICLSRFSMPDFKVTVEEGHPLQAPLRTTLTTPFL